MITAQLVRTVGKSRVTISVEGCVDCGAVVSPSWTDERRHQIILGARREYLTFKRCADCSARRGRPSTYEAPTALQRRFETAR